MTYLELEARLTRAGCARLSRGSTSHVKWRTPRGRLVVTSGKRSGGDVSPGVLAKIERALRSEGRTLDDRRAAVGS